jgi:hypothetical protein
MASAEAVARNLNKWADQGLLEVGQRARGDVAEWIFWQLTANQDEAAGATPVRTGRTRAAWGPEINGALPQTPPRDQAEYTPRSSIAVGNEVAGHALTIDVAITNPLPHVEGLRTAGGQRDFVARAIDAALKGLAA